MAEMGTDTGIFMGSIQISADSTLDYEHIQAADGDTLTASFYDETTITGFPQLMTGTCSVVALPVPTESPPSHRQHQFPHRQLPL
ncbi:MAG: hypothetical protein HS127_05495 [Planctomycetia bacterium]|nr:hypothetical protein [Planctomycetia bacterium]